MSLQSPNNNDQATREFRESVVESLEKEFLPKIFQKAVISLLKNHRIFKRDYLSQIREFYQESEDARDRLLQQLTGDDVHRAKIDCQRGCFYCCSMIVKPTMPELYIILEHIERNYSRHQVDALMERLRQHEKERERSDTTEERVKVYCSFLEDKVCMIHDVKPLSCRAYTSSDVEKCIAFLTDPSIDIPTSICHYSPFDFTRKAIMKSMYISGFTDVTEELNSGMLRLLEGQYGKTGNDIL